LADMEPVHTKDTMRNKYHTQPSPEDLKFKVSPTIMWEPG